MTALQWIVKEAKSIKKKYPKRFSKWTEYVAQASAIYASKHKGKSPVGKKKAAPKKKAAKKRKVAGVKASKEVKKVLAKKGLKMPHGYTTTKRVRSIGKIAKYKVGEKVYSYQNKDYSAPISYVIFNPWDKSGIPNKYDTYKYKLSLKDGYSNWIDEKSISKKSLGAVKKHKKISEQSILNRIHKVKDDVSKLDEAQHKHMMSGVKNVSNRYLETLDDINNYTRILNSMKIQYYGLTSPEKIRAKQVMAKFRKIIKELKTHAKELKKNI